MDDVALRVVAAARRRRTPGHAGRGRDAAADRDTSRRSPCLRAVVGERREHQSDGILQGTRAGGRRNACRPRRAEQFVVPTAGNAGVALAAYATRAGVRARIYAPTNTPAPILAQVRAFGGDLQLVDGHIGDCGIAARLHSDNTGAVDVSTLREPYRIEGKKTLGLELAEQLGWTLPDAIVYPTGGGTGLIGMWKAFQELRDSGWIRGPLPRMYTVQATGCAPVVEAFESGAERTTACSDPKTVAAGLRVPSPLGDRLMLRALRDSKGGAVAVSDEVLLAAANELQTSEGIDASPEGGAALAGAVELKRRGQLSGSERVVLFNTGAGWLYRA